MKLLLNLLKMDASSSPAGSFNINDVLKSLRDAFVFLVGAFGVLMTWGLLNGLTDCQTDAASCPVPLGQLTFVLPALISFVGGLLAFFRRLMTDYTQ